MADSRRKPRQTLKKKMLLYAFALIALMTILSIYGLTIMNVYKGRIDEMFQRNLALEEIGQELTKVDDELVAYLSTKSSSSLNSYMQSEEGLRDSISFITEDINVYSEEELLMMDINNMVRNYLSIANQAIQDKRRSNVTAYNTKYDDATLIRSYIDSYINELNIRQLGRNANNYVIMTREINKSIILNVALIIDLILLSVLIVINMSGAMIDPIVRLSNSANEIAKGDFETGEIIVETNDELEILARAFNKMKRSIHAYIEALKEKAYTEALLKDQEMENIKMQALLDNARLYALQSQMNPHFLFNTINAGVQMAMIEGADRTSEFLETMSRLFRYNIKQLDEAVSLGQEVANIEDYYELLKVRFGDQIAFDFTVDEEALDTLIPPLTLQPIVENAYIHGLSKREGVGQINIRIQKEATRVIAIIEDNGVGMSEERIHYIYESVNHEHRPEKTKSSNGIGMANVIERLELFYRSENVIEIESEVGVGTLIRLILPTQGGNTDD